MVTPFIRRLDHPRLDPRDGDRCGEDAVDVIPGESIRCGV
jgi:hypothetical protein